MTSCWFGRTSPHSDDSIQLLLDRPAGIRPVAISSARCGAAGGRLRLAGQYLGPDDRKTQLALRSSPRGIHLLLACHLALDGEPELQHGHRLTIGAVPRVARTSVRDRDQ